MFDLILADIQHYKSRASLAKTRIFHLVWKSPSLKTIMVYRLGRWLRRIGKQPLYWPIAFVCMPMHWLATGYVRLASDIFLYQTADIGPGLYIGHLGGIRLNNCRLGAHCSIHQEVRLEPLTDDDKGPTIGDRVWIGAHACIRGDVRIGDGATIGAGALVDRDVEPGCLVLGNPARVMKKNYDNSSFL